MNIIYKLENLGMANKSEGLMEELASEASIKEEFRKKEDTCTESSNSSAFSNKFESVSNSESEYEYESDSESHVTSSDSGVSLGSLLSKRRVLTKKIQTIFSKQTSKI